MKVQKKTWHACSKEEQIERWERILKMLKEMGPHKRKKHYNIETWGKKTPCGTVACIAGHAGRDKWFRRRGFRMELSEWPAPSGPAFPETQPEDFFGLKGYTQIFKNMSLRTVEEAEVRVKEFIEELKETHDEN